MIQVTRPFLPAKEVYDQYINDIWKRNWLTNNGPLVNELEMRLKEYLGLEHLLFLSNGTIGLQLAIEALELDGEIITTPFSYVATTSSIVWQRCVPVFADIDSETFNINPREIEASITEKTVAILATHVYGNPCDIERIQAIAQKNDLKVIYDAAHCFGTRYKGKSVLEYGDISMISFHATKLFHTVEGGALVSNQAELIKKMSYLRNFGHEGTEAFQGIGINGKNSEFHAAMGLSILPHVDEMLSLREKQWRFYADRLVGQVGTTLKINPDADYNYAYFPLLFRSEDQLFMVKKALENHMVYPRRYFYPLLSNLNYVKSPAMPKAEKVAQNILCLPLYHDLSEAEQEMICRLILRTMRYDAVR